MDRYDARRRPRRPRNRPGLLSRSTRVRNRYAIPICQPDFRPPRSDSARWIRQGDDVPVTLAQPPGRMRLRGADAAAFVGEREIRWPDTLHLVRSWRTT